MKLRRKRKIPEINSSSSADIAFLLLIFFLITTSLDSTKGLYRRLPPPEPKESVKEKMEIRKRNLLSLSVDGKNQVFANNNSISIPDLQKLAKEFIDNPDNDASLPEKIEEEIPFAGLVPVTKDHVISLQVNRETDYQTYISVQNALVGAYNELRNEFSIKQFGVPFSGLDTEHQDAVRKVYPLKISELEPVTDIKEKQP